MKKNLIEIVRKERLTALKSRIYSIMALYGLFLVAGSVLGYLFGAKPLELVAYAIMLVGMAVSWVCVAVFILHPHGWPRRILSKAEYELKYSPRQTSSA